MPEEQVVPVETQEQSAAPEIQAETTPESATGDSTEPHTEGSKGKGGFQRRIDKLTREKADKEREAEFWRTEALRNKPTETKTEATAKPKETDFNSHAEYVEALTDWKVDERVKAFKAEQNAEKAKTHQQTVEQTFKQRQEEFRKATPDFDEVLADADMEVSKALIDEIVTNENGAALQYFLAKNPDEAARLSAMNPVALAREVGRLESRFTTTPSTKTAKVTGAPPPPNPVGKPTPTSTKTPGEMSPSEYRVWRAKNYPEL